MRGLHCNLIMDAVRQLWVEANTVMPPDIRSALERAMATEESPLGRELLERTLAADQMAWTQGKPIAQDTGLAVVYLELGQEVRLVGGDLGDAVNEGIRRGSREAGLYPVVVADPFGRSNTGDNTPAILHLTMVAGEGVRLWVAPAGYQEEKATALKVFRAYASREELTEFILDAVRGLGADPCPPLLVGVGLGGISQQALDLSRRALLHPVGERNPDPAYASWEEALMEEINALGIGPQSLGGTTTALAVHILSCPTHQYGAPCAVSLGGCTFRRAGMTL